MTESLGGRLALLADPLGLAGTIVDGRYLIDRVVGSGGFGVVYRARHLRFDAPIAIKVLHRAGELRPAQQAAFLERFLSEGKLLFDLSPLHQSFVRALESGTVVVGGGVILPYLALEWLDGLTLQEEIARQRKHGRRLSLVEVLSLFDRAASGLAIAHARGVAHRDVKPANIFLARQHQQIAVKLLDFGLAKAMDQSLAHADAFGDSQFASCPFTPAYGAPEQWQRSLGATGPWTDVHALALVCAELLAGRHPFGGGESGELMAACLDPRVRPTPRTLGAIVSDEVEAAFAQALQLDPRERFRDAAEFWKSLCSAASFSERAGVPIVLTSDQQRADAPEPPATTLPTQRGVASTALPDPSETDPRTALTSPARPGRSSSRAGVAMRNAGLLFASGALTWFGLTAAQKFRTDEPMHLATRPATALRTSEPAQLGVSTAVAAFPLTTPQSSNGPLPRTAPPAKPRLRAPSAGGSALTQAAHNPDAAPATSVGSERSYPSSTASANADEVELRRLMKADAFSLRK